MVDIIDNVTINSSTMFLLIINIKFGHCIDSRHCVTTIMNLSLELYIIYNITSYWNTTG